MSGYFLWAVLAPGELAWLESRARTVLGLEEENEVRLPFKIIQGHSRYHAIVSLEALYIGAEMQIAEQLSLECSEPVYSIEQASPPPAVCEYRDGVGEMLEVEPRELAQRLGCPFPKPEEPPEHEARRPLRSAALVEGVLAQEALRLLEEEAGHPLPPGRFRFEDTPKGLIITGGTGDLGFADITLSERVPHVTVYGVTASPNLDIFFATMQRGGVGLAEFAHPPEYRDTLRRPVSEIKGESTPERILSALGIPSEWFR